jgi:hypothetical protein
MPPMGMAALRCGHENASPLRLLGLSLLAPLTLVSACDDAVHGKT